VRVRLIVAAVCAAAMLLPLVAIGGPRRPSAARPSVQPARLADRPHPCTPYAGCDVLTLVAASGSQAP